MTWNYRVVEHRYLDEENDYAVHEVFYDDDGNPEWFSEMPIAPLSKEEAELILKAYDEPAVAYIDKKALDDDNDEWDWL